MATKPRKKPEGSGRKPGTPNKITKVTKSFIERFLAHYAESGQMEDDWNKAGAKLRLMMMEKMLEFQLPKQTRTSVDLTASVDKQTVIDLLNAEADS